MTTRLLFIVNAHEFTAAHRLPLLRGAEAAGFSVAAVAPVGSPALKRLEREGFTTHAVRLSRRGLRAWEDVGSILELMRLYRRLKPDLVHHATIKPVIYGTLAARGSGKPAVVNAITGLGYVYTSSDWQASLLRLGVNALYRVAFRYSPQRIIFQNRDDSFVLRSIGAVGEDQSVLIPGSGVDMTTFTPTPEAEGVPVVVMAARLIWDKGVAQFVEAARLLQEKGVLARFVLVGELDIGNPTSIRDTDLQRWVDEGVVEWWGQVGDMRMVYEKSHIVVLPSYYREGLPKVLIEAAASARPTVSTDAPGCRDALIDGETGYLVPVRDSTSLAARIGDLLSDSELRRQMGRAGRELVEREFSTERVVSETLAVYESLLRDRR